MIESSCVCGAVRLAITRAPDELVDCNCSICRRYARALGLLLTQGCDRSRRTDGRFHAGPKKIEFHRCKICGCVTHWSPRDQRDEMGVNARLMEPEVVARARVRHLDGADTWKFLD